MSSITEAAYKNESTSNELTKPDKAPGLSISFSFQSIVFAIIIFVTLYVARGFLLPVTASVLLSYALLPFVRFLTRLKIPRIAASFIVVSAFFAVVVYTVFAISGPAIEWLEKAPQSFQKLEETVNALKKPVENVNAATKQLNEMTQGRDNEREVVVRLEESSIVEMVLSQTPLVIGGAVSILILLFFILAFGNLLLKRVVEVSPRLKDKKRAVEAAREIERSVSTYLVTVVAINTVLGFCIGFALFALGFENPVLWGTLATILNFIPYLGAVAGVGLITLASLSTSPDLTTALAPPAAYLLITLVEGNLITPMILGRSFMINPIFIILVLLFLGWLWGIPGAIMAVPILVALKSGASHFESSRSIATVLSR